MNEMQTTIAFTRNLIVAGAILLLVGVVMVCYLATVKQPDVTQYYHLLESSQASANKETLQFSARQEHEGVQKMVILSKESGRHALRLTSEESVLRFDRDEKGGSLVEEMETVACDQQEALFYRLPDGRELEEQANGRLLLVGGEDSDPDAWFDRDAEGLLPMQRVRHVDAKKATYYYKRDLLSAEKVDLVRFNEESHTLPLKWKTVNPMMHGMAESVNFSMAGSDPSFKAYHLKLTLYSREGLL